MQPKDVVILVLAICAGIFLIALLALALKLRSIKKQAESGEERAAKVKIVGGVRYSEDDAIADPEGMNVTHLPNDFILARNDTALSANGGDRNFKLRVGGLVKNFVHGDEVVLGEGEEVCAVSATVILR